ncbi:uncharacterized protein RHOBADRAFT_51429 [Rhodotorula graminis WP1]|uniref:Osmotin, thaumatin-like protein n=1 Tax=Rhodotorula graminis (strain WP1) TaxID=578459 RepID=A0A194SDU5_RHOGW|nr:uncharacterized protein RHOBADRAFT_51429 [Rhodotorula graminis WP1]KPV77596.1 hypothetical protein RHOBADRAFT_51429 [Rhodotorula graminis WP1]
MARRMTRSLERWRPPPRLLVAVALLPARALAADRQFTIVNSCDFTVWPAVTNWNEGAKYTGVRGWEAAAGSEKSVTVPERWNGRVWARRACKFDADGKGSCVTGDCPGGLECDDNTIGWVNVGEFNLNAWGGNDFWDISAVPGWTGPMSIEPDGCDSLSCTEDVLAACPDDRMKQKDGDGNVIGCLSACMAGINAVEPSVNCCSGKYNNVTACLPGDVDFYDRFVNTHTAYDYQKGDPAVDYACPSANSPNYKVTFCPGGKSSSSSANSSGASGGAADSSATKARADAATTLMAEEMSSTEAAGTGSTRSGTSTARPTAATSNASSADEQQHNSLSTPTPNQSGSTSSPSPAAAASTDESAFLGVSKPVALAVVGCAVALPLGMLAHPSTAPSATAARS